MDSAINCEVCSTAMNQTQTALSCGHFVCSQCTIRNIFFNHLEEIATQDALEIKCKKCSYGSISISVETISQMMINLNPKHQCDNHKAFPGKLHCMNCEKWLCEVCLELHSEVYKDHQLTEKKIVLKTCNYHHDKFREFYCYDCEDEICKSCVTLNTTHMTHTCQPINEYIAELKKQSHSEHLPSHIEQIGVKFKDSFQSAMDLTVERFDQLIKKLEESKETYISKMNKACERADILINLIQYIYSDFNTTYSIDFLKESSSTMNFDITGLELKNEAESHLQQIEEKLKEINAMGGAPFEILWGKSNWKSCFTMTGHTGYVYALLQLSDGRIASASWDMTIRLWEMSDNFFRNSVTLAGHMDWVCSLTQLKDGRLASGAKDKTIKIWEASGTTFKNTITLTDHSNSVLAIIQLKDGRMISGAKDKTIKVWEVGKSEIKNTLTLTEHTDSIRSLLLLKDGRFASGADDATIRIWEVQGKIIQNTLTLTGHSSNVGALIQLRDGRIASGSNDHSIKIWVISEKDFKNTMTITGHSDWLMSLVQLKDGRIASAACDRSIKIWKVFGDVYKNEMTLNDHTSYVSSIIQLKDGRIASASEDRTVKIWKPY